MPDQTRLAMRPRYVLAVAAILLAMPATMAVAHERAGQQPDVDLFALMSGKCTTFRIAGRSFGCKAAAFFHGQQGRAIFTIVLDDPNDASHIVSFSGEDGRRQDDLFELPIDRMLLNSGDRPKADGLPVPSVESAAGICRQFGNFASRQVSSIACSATDNSGRKYELQFQSDGSPIAVRKIRQAPLMAENRRLRQNQQRECRRQAYEAKILPRDQTAFLIGCLADDSQKPLLAEPQ